MPTFREDTKIGSKVPLIKTADLNDKSVTEKKLADGSITKDKIADESVSAEKLQSGLRSTIVSTHDKAIELDKKKANVTDVDYALECLEKKIGDRVVVEGNVTNLPDDEDLTSVQIGGREVVKLNDRAYEPSNFSGKGYKILRKNIQRLSLPTATILVSNIPSSSGSITITINGKATTVSLDVATDTTTAIIATKIGTALKASLDDYDVSVSSNTIVLTRNNSKYASPSSIDVGNTTAGISVKDSITKSERKNVLTQDMINDPNTIYEIRYDFDLNGAEITLPENCVLKFNGGSLNNGTLKGRVLIENKNGNLINIEIQDDFSIKDDETFIVDNNIWGIFNDGTSSEVTTAGINNAFIFAHKLGFKKVKLLPGTYLVEIKKDLLYNKLFNECVVLYSDTEYDFTNVTIKQQAHANQQASLLLLFDCTNTSILNGTLIGDRVTHDYTTGTSDRCYGINIVTSKNVLIKDTTIYDFPSDAIFITGTSSLDYKGQGQFNPNTGSKQVSISGCDLSHCRRQGISIVNAFDTLVENCNIHDISLNEEMGIAPGSGIDLEPWNETFVAEIVLRTTIKNCTFNNNRKHIVIANIFAHSTLITGCVFESKKPEEKPQYVSDLVYAVQNNANSNSPKFTNTLNNKYPIDIYWEYDNTIVSNCTCKYNYIYATPVVTECTFTGEYCGISSQSINTVDSYICNIQRCKFDNSVYLSGKGIIQFYDCIFDNAIGIFADKYYMDNCIVLQASDKLKNLFNVTIKQCRISPIGKIDACDITFSGEPILDGVTYANVEYKNCILKFNKEKDIAINTGLKYTLSISNCRLLINTPNKIVQTAKGVILNDNIIEVNHNNNTYTQNYFNNENLIAVNNIIINKVATSTAKTFNIGKLIKDNFYIGDKLSEETIPLVKGKTSQRPTLVDVGFEYYDTTLKKKIIWNGTEWTNMDGTALV